MPPLYNAVDAHTHLDFEAFDADRDAVVARAREAGVQGFVIAAGDPDHWDRVQSVAAEVGAACCLGIHPWWVGRRTEAEVLALLEDLAGREGVDGIGETGLDWVRAKGDEDRAIQSACYAAHIELAHDIDLPLVLHVVRAHAEALGILAAIDLPPAGGMVHAWSAGPEWVQPAVDIGLYLSFGTDLARSDAVRAALREVPNERLLLETDCPDRPLPTLGRAPIGPSAARGEPAQLVQIATLAAEIRGTTADAILNLCGENARTLFRGAP